MNLCLMRRFHGFLALMCFILYGGAAWASSSFANAWVPRSALWTLLMTVGLSLLFVLVGAAEGPLFYHLGALIAYGVVAWVIARWLHSGPWHWATWLAYAVSAILWLVAFIRPLPLGFVSGALVAYVGVSVYLWVHWAKALPTNISFWWRWVTGGVQAFTALGSGTALSIQWPLWIGGAFGVIAEMLGRWRSSLEDRITDLVRG